MSLLTVVEDLVEKEMRKLHRDVEQMKKDVAECVKGNGNVEFLIPIINNTIYMKEVEYDVELAKLSLFDNSDDCTTSEIVLGILKFKFNKQMEEAKWDVESLELWIVNNCPVALYRDNLTHTDVEEILEEMRRWKVIIAK